TVDGKPSLEENEVYFLRCELAQARERIEQLESSQSKLQEKLTSQSQRLLSLGIGNNRFEGSNLDETNRVNALIRRYEHLYSQGNNRVASSQSSNDSGCICSTCRRVGRSRPDGRTEGLL